MFDTIVLDTAAGMGVPFEAAMGVAHRALLVAYAGPCIHTRRTHCVRRAEAGGCPEYVLSSTGCRARWHKRRTSSDECIDTVGAQLIGVVPFSTELQQSGRDRRAGSGRRASVWRCAPCRTPVRTMSARDSINMREDAQMNIALIAHDSKKELMVQFCIAYCRVLSSTICARQVRRASLGGGHGPAHPAFSVRHPWGDQQIAARIACNEIDLLLFFRDPISAKPHEPKK